MDGHLPDLLERVKMVLDSSADDYDHFNVFLDKLPSPQPIGIMGAEYGRQLVSAAIYQRRQQADGK